MDNSDELADDSSNEFKLLFDFVTLTTEIDDACNTDPDAVVSDDYQGSNLASNAMGPVCNRGRRAGGYATQNMASGGVVMNSGISSGAEAYISGVNGSVFCVAKQTCYGQTITFAERGSGGTVYCSSDESCSGTEIINATNVYCDGTRLHCSDTRIIGATNIYSLGTGYYPVSGGEWISGGVGNFTVYFGAHRSGEYTNIYCNQTDTCNIICGMYAMYVVYFVYRME